ncbi:DUF4132 domain-containing protein [Chitinophaga sp. Cy-1792]|uniref:DUF4132 domain-containing protein n=1 Tax=Chitinophaga sp. Cy-1792 TaxID=2608339 RepID=UPI001423D83C|nr:DUF4132 domain-containing protein [Chitinophaga sp. Cy-1792]NIG54721.1 DUF4132 domain-containing protein [Chitinophaga sp. Cy-1792]
MDVKGLLQDRLKPDYMKNMLATLTSVADGTTSHNLLTQHAATAGLVLLNEHPDYKITSRGYGLEEVSYGDKRYEFLLNFLGTEEWDAEEPKQLLYFIFGEALTPAVIYAWKQLRYSSYQRGYYRRSFRAPSNRELYFPNQVNFLMKAVPQCSIQDYHGLSKICCYDLSMEEQVLKSHMMGGQNMVRIWSAAMDLGDDSLFQTMEDIIFNKSTEGKVTTQILHALLISNEERCWQLVEKLLLAAQRQEGLRQTIVEALDECSLGAMKYMMNVIIKEKLFRFSSVVRALDVWAGLGWMAEKESTVKTFFEKGFQYLTKPETIVDGVAEINNGDVWMALWAQGILDVQETLPYLQRLLDKGTSEKKCLALRFAGETKHFMLNMPLFEAALDSNDMAVLGSAVMGILHLLNSHKAHYNQYYPQLFDKLRAILDRIDTKEKNFEGKVFSWLPITYSRKYVLQCMANMIDGRQDRLDIMMSYFDEMDIEVREQLTRVVLPIHSDYNWKEKKKKENAEVTAFQRDYAYRILKDRGEFNVNVAFRVFGDMQLEVAEMEPFVDILKRKSASNRSRSIDLILNQQDEKVATVNEQLLQGDAEQRLAGLDIALQLRKKERLANKVNGWVAAFQERKSISQKEEILLEQLTTGDILSISPENGFGIFNPAVLTSTPLPEIDPENYFEQRSKVHPHGLSVSPEVLHKALESLHELFQANGKFEYEAEQYDGSKQTFLLANHFTSGRYNHTFESVEEQFNSYPLAAVWNEWYQQSGLSPVDLFLIGISSTEQGIVNSTWTAVKELLPGRNVMMPKALLNKYAYPYMNPVVKVINVLAIRYPFAEKNDYLLGLGTRLYHSLTPEILNYQNKREYWSSAYHGDGWQTLPTLNLPLENLSIGSLTVAQAKVAWQLFRWRQYNGLPQNIVPSKPPLSIFCHAYEQGIISDDEMYDGIITVENIRLLSDKRKKSRHNHKKNEGIIERFAFLEPMYNRIRETFLDAELKRGDSATPVTVYVQAMFYIPGMNRFFQLLAGLGKSNLNRGYIYSYADTLMSKVQLFSTLLKRCFPAESDTQAIFDAGMKTLQAPEQRLIEASVYAPQWQKFVSSSLQWKGLDAAIWWMHAHTKTSGYQEQNAEAESEIARYSAVDLQDFKDGAVDKDWFIKAYKEIGKARWAIVYDAAKYISDGNAHRRARLYADVITGDLKIKEVSAKVKDKRDQDYLRIYGLIPLAKANPAKDVLARYAYLQQFHKETKQWGAQKQASENLAYRIAMENLARNAGYADPQRLSWAMETKQVQDILAANTQVKYDDTLIGLVIDEEGMADVVAFKGDKKLASIPPKYKKDTKVLELQEYRKVLREQFRRSKKALEDAMVKADAFLGEELKNLFGHPVITKHLEKLVFITDHGAGFYSQGKLTDPAGKEYALQDKDEVRIAHCSDLHQLGQWSDYQHYCFKHQLQQPFKQVFRELYLPLEEELKEVTISRRYAGHQVQPAQTVALLKGRGWKVDYEEGLQKVFHKNGFVAKIYAQANWFTPAEVESPTLETIEFHDLKSYKSVAFKDIPVHIFSEVMRDLDLVVSVAHVGGVDPEASHSSIEMRAVLLQESARLFKLNNVSVKGNHALIKGHYGEYSIHLGSAVVFQLPGNYLSILPVHSQHRGRLFLPFADDDPKSAELISKVLLLARDKEIQDPTVLRQIDTVSAN